MNKGFLTFVTRYPHNGQIISVPISEIHKIDWYCNPDGSNIEAYVRLHKTSGGIQNDIPTSYVIGDIDDLCEALGVTKEKIIKLQKSIDQAF